MAKIDPKFTEKLVAWLKSDHTSDEKIREGAMLLLQLNRNRILYQQIIRTPQRMLKKLEYEVQKHVNIRLDGYSLSDIKKLEDQAVPEVSVSLECVKEDNQIPIVHEAKDAGDTATIQSLGKRQDHDSLPEEIRKIWDENAERWKKIKQTFETLKTLDAPCDRYEYAKVLAELWKKYKSEMCRYDDFKSEQKMPTDNESSKLPEEDQKKVDQAQSYISRFLPGLLELVTASHEDGFTDDQSNHLESLREKIQARVDILINYNVQFSEERRQQLTSADIRLALEETSAEEEETTGNEEITDAKEEEDVAAAEQPAEEASEEETNVNSDAEGEKSE